MKKTIVLILFLLSNFIFANAQIKSFEKYLSSFGSFEITEVIENNNYYYLLCNQSYDTFDQQSSFVLRVNMEGDSIYYHDINLPFHYVLRSFIKSIKGGFCFVGSLDSMETNFNSSRDGLLVETDINMNILDMNVFKMSSKNELNKIIIDSGYYYAIGNIFKTFNNVDIQALKIDSNGILIDSISLDFRSLDAVTSITNSNSNLLISGTILGGQNDGYLSLLSKTLDTIFFKKYNVTYDSNNRPIALWYSYASKFSKNDDILFPCVFFVRNPIDTTDLKAYEHSGLIRTDKNGNIKSLNIYYLNSSHDRPINIFETNDNHFIIAGTINFAPTRPISQNINGNYYLMKVDTLGNIIWFKQYGDSNYQELKSIIQTYDGGFVLSGYSISNYTNQERIGYIVKTDSNGNIILGFNNELNTNSLTTIYPNPTSSTLNIQSNFKFIYYTIYDIYGKKIRNEYLNGNTLSIIDIPNGIYILKLENDRVSQQLKFIKE